MTQSRCGLGFLTEARPSFGVAHRCGRQHFDGDGTVEMGVERAVNYAHSSRSQLVFDAVMAESFADHLQELGPSVYLIILTTRTYPNADPLRQRDVREGAAYVP